MRAASLHHTRSCRGRPGLQGQWEDTLGCRGVASKLGYAAYLTLTSLYYAMGGDGHGAMRALTRLGYGELGSLYSR